MSSMRIATLLLHAPVKVLQFILPDHTVKVLQFILCHTLMGRKYLCVEFTVYFDTDNFC